MRCLGKRSDVVCAAKLEKIPAPEISARAVSGARCYLSSVGSEKNDPAKWPLISDFLTTKSATADSASGEPIRFEPITHFFFLGIMLLEARCYTARITRSLARQDREGRTVT